MEQPSDVNVKKDSKHPTILTMFYGSLFLYALIVIVAVGAVVIRAT